MIGSLAKEYDEAMMRSDNAYRALTEYMNSEETKILQLENDRARQALAEIREKLRRII
jgi:hypothetical protein